MNLGERATNTGDSVAACGRRDSLAEDARPATLGLVIGLRTTSFFLALSMVACGEVATIPTRDAMPSDAAFDASVVDAPEPVEGGDAAVVDAGYAPWANPYGSGVSIETSIATGPDREVVVTGSAGWMNVGDTVIDGAAGFVIKLDELGHPVFGKFPQFDESSTIAPTSVGIDGSGVIHTVGVLRGNMDFGAGILSTTWGMYRVVFSKTGVVVSQKVYSGVHDAKVIVRADGSSSILFITNGGTTDFGGGAQSRGVNDLVLVRYGVDGSYISERALGRMDFGWLPLVQGCPNGNIVFTGWLNAKSTFDLGAVYPPPNNFDTNGFVVMTDPGGTVLWGRNFASSGGNAGYAIAADDSSNVYVAMYLASALDFGTGPQVGHLLIKWDSSGVVQWSQALSNNSPSMLVATGAPDVDLIINGAPSIDGGIGGGSTFLATRFSPTGTMLGTTKLGQGRGYVRAATRDGAGKLLITGEFSGPIDFGHGQLVPPTINMASLFVASYLH